MVILGAFSFAVLEPMPGAVHSTAEMFVYFVIPMVFVQAIVVFAVFCAQTWMSEQPYRCDIQAVFDTRGIEQVLLGDRSLMAWSNATRFKESPWTFYIWWPGTPAWTMVPKRGFASKSDIDRCRALLQAHAEKSTWFWS